MIPVELHFGQHIDQRHFDPREELLKAGLCQLGFQHAGESQRNVGIFGGIAGNLTDGHFVHPPLPTARPNELADGNRLVVQIAPGKFIERVAALPRFQEVIGDHRVELHAAQLDAVIAQDDQVILQVLSDFSGLVPFQRRPQDLQRLTAIQADFPVRSTQRNVVSLPFEPAEGTANQFGKPRAS